MNATDLAEWLNKSAKGSVARKITEAVSELSRVEAEAGFKRLPSSLQTGLQKSVLAKLADLNRRIRSQRFFCRVSWTSRKPLRIFFTPQSGTKSGRFILQLLQLSEAGRLDFLRVCEYCGKFFVARRHIDRFHSGACKSSWHHKTPAGREYNRKYQEKYRKDEKDRNSRWKSKARMTSRRTIRRTDQRTIV